MRPGQAGVTGPQGPDDLAAAQAGLGRPGSARRPRAPDSPGASGEIYRANYDAVCGGPLGAASSGLSRRPSSFIFDCKLRRLIPRARAERVTLPSVFASASRISASSTRR